MRRGWKPHFMLEVLNRELPNYCVFARAIVYLFPGHTLISVCMHQYLKWILDRNLKTSV